MNKIINTHSHIFNFECVPDSFLSNYVARFFANIGALLLRKRLLATPILYIMRKVANGNFKKFLDFAIIGNSKTVEDVYIELKKDYQSIYPEARFVVLTQNFDHMDNKGYPGLFRTQLEWVKDLKRKYKNDCLPFLGIDPRQEVWGQSLNSFLAEFFNTTTYSGFVGVKIYPSLGFYPFHPRMVDVYSFCQGHQLPIMTHCTPDGAFWASKKVPKNLQFPLSFNPLGNSTTHPHIPQRINAEISSLKSSIQQNYHLKPENFCDYFLHPLNYWDVLDRYPELKICFAHLGGEQTIQNKEKREIPRDWYRNVKELLNENRFTNVYADVSYVLHDDAVIEVIKKDLENGDLPIDRILFGTDFFMTIRRKSEFNLVENFRKKIGEVLWKKLAVENPKAYLKSTFFTA